MVRGSERTYLSFMFGELEFEVEDELCEGVEFLVCSVDFVFEFIFESFDFRVFFAALWAGVSHRFRAL